VLRGLEKNRELRFETAVAFREAIETVLSVAGGTAAPLSPSVRAAMPTARDMAGSPPTPIDTATVPARSATDRFATTANLTGQSGTRQKVLVIAGVAVLLAGSAAAGISMARARRAQMTTAGPPTAATVAPAAPPTAAPAGPEVPHPAPPLAPAPAAAVVPPREAPTIAGVAAPRDVHGKRRPAVIRPAPSAATAPAATAAGGATDAPVAKPVSPLPAPEPVAAPPQTRGFREVLAEAEKLLAQGEVGDACARGEEAARIAPKAPPARKFLGKCYMRAGRTREANDNYKLYLELAPNAPDAPFVKSMIR